MKGPFIFNAWDRIGHNEVPYATRASAVAEHALLGHVGPGSFDAPIRSFEVVARSARREGAD